MKEEKIVVSIYPGNVNSLIKLSFDELRLPEDIDFGSIRVYDGNNMPLLFDLIEWKGYNKKLKFANDVNYTHIAILLKKKDCKQINIDYKISDKTTFSRPPKLINLSDNTSIIISTKNVSVFIEKQGFSIEKIVLGGKYYGPLSLVASGGDLFFQKDIEHAELKLVSDGSFLKIFKVKGKMKVQGNKCKNSGLLPVEMHYYFYSSDGKDLIFNLEINIKYDKSADFNGNSLSFIDPLLWYRLENFNDKIFVLGMKNEMSKSTIVTLRHPFQAYFFEGENIFLMSPYLALPNDGIHIEKGENFFGACWHSLSEKKSPYWLSDNPQENIGKSQGYYPAHSIAAFWRIGFFLGKKPMGSVSSLASTFSYPAKILNVLHIGSGQVSNPYITRWKENKKMAFSAITDDGKVNDYLYRVNKMLPKWVEIALPTRTKFKISYHRFCAIGKRIFNIKKIPFLSTILSTFLCLIRIAKPLRKFFFSEKLSFIPHTNTHAKIYELQPKKLKQEIKISEEIWIKKWKFPIPLSHVFSYTSGYGLSTPEGTRESIAFDSSEYVQWIRIWPIPHTPIDFFLPKQLFWGISIGEIFTEGNCKKIIEEFNNRADKADYMIISGHVPDDKVCPEYVTNMFAYLEKNKEVWFAKSDDIIKYYKSRENISISRLKKEENFFLIELENDLPDYFLTDITLMQHVKGIKSLTYSIDGENYHSVKYAYFMEDIIIYNIPSNTKLIRIE